MVICIVAICEAIVGIIVLKYGDSLGALLIIFSIMHGIGLCLMMYKTASHDGTDDIDIDDIERPTNES